MTDVFDQVAALRRSGEPFALATVVRRSAPVSSHLGDRAIVHADGRMEGFVGGSCARDIVRAQALAALASRQPRLVSIRPDAPDDAASDGEQVVIRMSCASEGAVDVFIEPVVRPRRLVVAGASPVARALASLARTLDYGVFQIVEDRERADTAASTAPGVEVMPLGELAAVAAKLTPDDVAVVASQGHYDEEALETLLPAGLAYVGLLASRKRGATVLAYVEGKGIAGTSAVRCPAGLDLGAKTASGVAVSILAEIVQVTAAADLARGPRAATADAAADPGDGAGQAGRAPAQDTAIDPVCGMAVTIATARHRAEFEGATYYFCCPHCRAEFVGNPQPYLATRQ